MAYYNNHKRDNIDYKFRRNEYIRAEEVRAIDEEGNFLGIMRVPEALKIARERELDLIEIAPQATPPVVKVISWSKFKYEYSKKQKSTVQKGTQTKEMWFKPMTDIGDLQHKVKKVRNFLNDKNKVKITVKPGRDKRLGHSYYFDVINRVLAELADDAEVETPPKVEGKNVYAIIKPKR